MNDYISFAPSLKFGNKSSAIFVIVGEFIEWRMHITLGLHNPRLLYHKMEEKQCMYDSLSSPWTDVRKLLFDAFDYETWWIEMFHFSANKNNKNYRNHYISTYVFSYCITVSEYLRIDHYCSSYLFANSNFVDYFFTKYMWVLFKKYLLVFTYIILHNNFYSSN